LIYKNKEETLDLDQIFCCISLMHLRSRRNFWKRSNFISWIWDRHKCGKS